MENPEARQSWKVPEPWSKGSVAALLLILATIVVYWPALHGGFLWDDDDHISANIKLRSLSGLWDIWFKPGATMQYYPLTFTGFWAGYHLWGLNPFGYHLLNVVLHGAVAVLLWQVLERLKVRGALLAGAIFALHPVNVMSVAWMTELKNTLSGALALGASWAYVRFAGLGVYAATEPELNKNPSALCWRYGVLSLALFLLAMFAKTAVSFLPVSLLLVLWWQRERLRWREVWPLPAMLGMVVVMGQVTFHIERLYGAAGPEFNLALLDRVLISGRSFWFYLGKLSFPYPLTFIYERWEVDAGAWWQYLYPLATVGVLGALWTMRRRIGKGPFVAMLHFYVATSLLILIQVLYMTRFSFVTDHWQYFGCMSVIGMAAAGITMALGFLEKRVSFLKPLFAGVLLVVLAALTWRQAGVYRDSETLLRDTLKKNPAAVLAHNNLAILLEKQGKLADAEAHIRTALKIAPTSYENLNILGLILARQGRYAQAITCFESALQIRSDSADVYRNYGNALAKSGRIDEAIDCYGKALHLNPNFAPAHGDLGLVLLEKGNLDEAVNHLREAIRDDPDDANAHNNLGTALLRQGDCDAAIDQFQAALQLKPDYANAHNNLGLALAKLGKLDEAIAEYTAALRCDPNHALAHSNLAGALLAQGRRAEAKTHYLAAIQADPANAETHRRLGELLASQGDKTEAIPQFREAIRLNPDSITSLNNLAWVLATDIDPDRRNGAEAVQLSERAAELTEFKNPLILDTLAAAYAEAGRFAEAAATVQKALDLTDTATDERLAAAMRTRLETYKSGRPYRE